MRKFALLLAAELHRYGCETRKYLSNYISGLILTGILIAMFALSTDARSNPAAWAGYFLWTSASTMITEASISISTDKQDGTFTQLMLRPVSLLRQIIVKTLTWVLVSVMIDAVFISVLFAVLRIPMGLNWSSAGLIIIILCGLFGFTLIAASLTVVYTRTQAYSDLFTYVLMFLSGIVVPLEALPAPVMWIGRVLPLQYGYQLVQESFSSGVSAAQWLAAAAQSAAYILIGYALFTVIIRHGRKTGINMRY